METIYPKVEQMPTLAGSRPYYLGYKNNKSDKNQKYKNKDNNLIKLKYPSFKTDFDNCMKTDDVSIIASSPIKIQKNINKEDPALFLNFLDIDLFSKYSLWIFITQHGLLLNNNITKNKGYFEKIERIDFLNNEELNLKEELHTEPLSVWFLLQSRLRSLVSIWRLLSINEVPELLEMYIKENFIQKKKSTYYNHNLNYFKQIVAGNEKLKHRGFDFLGNNTKLKNLICFEISPEINLDRDYMDHQDLIEGSTYKNFWHPNFFVHFSNIFLTNKITEIQKVFPVRMEIDGVVTASPIVGDKKFVFNQNFQCDSLYSAMINQFIGAIKGNNNYIRCNQCRKWTLKIKVRKEKRLYCSDACRAKANRNRKTLDTYISLQVFKNYNSLADYVDAFLNQTLGKPGDPKNFFRKETDNENLIEFLERMVWDIILNFDALTNEQTIANHLGVEREFLGDLSFLRNKPFYSEIYLSNPYLDWDYNLSKEVR